MIGALIMAGASIAGGILGQQAALANKKAVRKAAMKNYNTMMQNSREMERSVYENMTSYQRDAAEYRSNMVAARSAMGGVRTVNEDPAQREVFDYEFDIDKVQTDKEGYKDELYTEANRKRFQTGGENENYQGSGGSWYNKSYQKYYQTKKNAEVDERNNDALYNALMNYEGRQAEFSPARTTANAIEQESVKELQADLNKTYVQGMQEVLHQRQAAQNAWQSMEAQGKMYDIQGMQSLWNGLLSGASSIIGGIQQQSAARSEAQWRSQQLAAWNRIGAGLEGLKGRM